MERQLTDRIETFDNEIVGHCVCNKVVYKVINTNLEMRKDKTRYRYPEDNRPVDIFRCSNCLQVISESWRAGVVENFEHVLTKEPQTEALNKHNVMQRSELLVCPNCKSDEIVEFLNRKKRQCQICEHLWQTNSA